MSVAQTTELIELRELYLRFKTLVLATGAALLLDSLADELAEQADALLADCRRAAAAAPPELEGPLSLCESAARELDDLLERVGADPTALGAGALDRLSASHRRLRHEVWKVIPCEYVPCAATHRHGAPIARAQA